MRKFAYCTLALALGCGPQLPELPGSDLPPAKDTHKSTQHSDDDIDNPIETTAPAAPTLDSAPAEFGFPTLPLTGKSGAHFTVFVEGGQSSVATEADAQGRFCLDVPLKQDQTQTLKVYAQSLVGLTSAPRTLSITHDASLAEPLELESELYDFAYLRTFFSTATPKEGSLTALSDGNYQTFMGTEAATSWVDLGQLFHVEGLAVTFPDAQDVGDDTFATEYMVLGSDEASPSLPPDIDDSDWMLLMDVYPDAPLPAGIGDGGEDAVGFVDGVWVRHVAFVWLENNKIDWFSTETIRISDVMIWGPLPAHVDAPVGPTCETAW